MTQRSPIYTRIGPRQWPVDLLTWIETPQPGAAPNPFIQRRSDWPNPQPQRLNHQLRVWTNGLPPGVVGNPVPPIRLRIWPDAFPRVINRDVLGWIKTPQPVPPVVVAAPFNQDDWPNPQPQRLNHELRIWIDGLPPGVVGNPVPPIRPNIWPDVFARSAGPLPELQINLQLTTLAPAAATQMPSSWDWTENPPARQNLELRTWTQGVPPNALPIPTPSGKALWPDAFPPIPNLELRTWTYQPAILPGSVGSPVSQSDWPNPRLRQYPQPIDPTMNLLMTTLKPIPPPVGSILPEHYLGLSLMKLGGMKF